MLFPAATCAITQFGIPSSKIISGTLQLSASLLRAAICKNRPNVCKMKKIEKFQKNPKHSPRWGMNGKILKTSLDFYFRRNRRFFDLRQIYANSSGFRLLHFKISKKFRKDRIESTFYTIEVEGCCYISVYFLKYLLRVGLFYRIFKMDNFSPPKNMHYYKDKKLVLVHRFWQNGYYRRKVEGLNFPKLQ